MDYALSEAEGKGGLVLLAREHGGVVGALILNNTGMSGYIPENILVYVAVHGSQRGKGVGKRLVQLATDNTEGSIALHVEPDNPARHLYEKMGFTNKYLEYRLIR
jgi:[ribosomal protein S18]-alanine N-acetyltransferase